MDPRLKDYYTRELQFIHEMGGEFAREFPKIAGRLGMEAFEVADPYVERLLEGVALLTARIQMKMDAEFPRLTHHLLQTIYPHFLAPTPSMCVVQLKPDASDAGLATGFSVPRGSVLRGQMGKGDQTACEYRTAHPVTLWPLELTQAEYTRSTEGVAPGLEGIRSGLRLRLKATAGTHLGQILVDRLPFFLAGFDEISMHLLELLFARSQGVVVSTGGRSAVRRILPRSSIRPVGFGTDESLIPFGLRSFQGYRLLHEYFAFPDRFMSFEIAGLADALDGVRESELELLVLFDVADSLLDKSVDTERVLMYAAPAVNLFPRRCDRIHLDRHQHEYHVVPDRTRPMDFEVFAIQKVTGFGTGQGSEQEFQPLFSTHNSNSHRMDGAYYSQRREQRLLSERQKRLGPRAKYVGSEVFLSIVDANETPYRSDLRQLGIEALCTNRDLPLYMPLKVGRSDFTLESGGPVVSIRCVAGPTRPRPSHADGEVAWRLVSHLSLNYLTLLDHDERSGAAAMRDLLMLYGNIAEAHIQKQIDGVKSVQADACTGRVRGGGPVAFARGLKIDVTMDEACFDGSGIFLLGAVLERFFGKYVSINSFTQTSLHSLERGEVMKWPARSGERHVL